jgi:hypothetical protein
MRVYSVCFLVFAFVAVTSAQSLWVGKATSSNTYNFTPGYVSSELTDVGSSTHFAFYDHSNGDSFTQLDLILAFVNPPVTAPSITGVKAYSNVGNVDGSNNVTASGGTASSVNITPSGPTQLNSGKVNGTALNATMPGINDSEQTSNYDTAETKDGITQTGGYALYVYNLSAYAAGFGDYGLLDLTFNGLPKGAIALGWGCGGTGCSTDYTSVFTQSGFASTGGSSSSVPEPFSLVLLGTAALAAFGLRRNSRA